MEDRVVIVGAGQGGFQAAASLRAEGYAGPITLIGEEPHLPYQRPPLSKEYLLGKQPIEKADLRPRAFFEAQSIDLLTGERVIEIDRADHIVRLASGGSIPYSNLVLATGARVRKLPADILSTQGVLYLRNRDDAIEIKQRLNTARSVTIIGGGFIGLEIAAAARALGLRVTVVEAQPRLMPRVVAPLISDFYRELHSAHGVELLFGSPPIPPADLVVAGIGVIPNDDLARAAGLDLALSICGGITVDQYLRTTDENIYAIGDCAEHANPYAADRIRLESVQNAVDQAKCAAANIAGRIEPYHAVPWFWTHQFDIMLQMAGLSAGAGQAVARGDPQSGKFSVYYFKQTKLIAVDSINRPADHILARKLLAANANLTPAQAADVNFDLKGTLA
jgi:3-phenylpropionate/trans-cinnamate dioxygenase ferredoxin reductase subunit